MIYERNTKIVFFWRKVENRRITSVLFHKRVVTLSKEAPAPIAKTSRRKIHLFPILLKKGVRFCQMYFSQLYFLSPSQIQAAINFMWDISLCNHASNLYLFSFGQRHWGAVHHDFMVARSGLRPGVRLFAIVINILLIHIFIVITIDKGIIFILKNIIIVIIFW